MTKLTPSQCRAARGLINWSQRELSEKASVSKKTVEQFELVNSDPYKGTLEKIRKALEKAGVQFIEENGGGAGVRTRKRK